MTGGPLRIATAFEERTKGLISQYDALVPLQLQPDGPHVNGSLTIGENIGDPRRERESLSKPCRFLLRELSPSRSTMVPWQQRFFLSYARIWREKQRDEALRTQIATDPTLAPPSSGATRSSATSTPSTKPSG